MKLFVKAMGWTVPLMAMMLSGAAWAEAPDHVTIRSISYAGSGCPAGTVAENLAPDYKAFTLLFDSNIAEAGPGVPFRESRKNCQINVDLEFPQGWSFTLVDVDYRGYVSLERRVQATQKSTYYFQGDRKSASLQSNFNGPKDQDYHIRDTLGLDAVVWSPCGASRSLNINTQVRVNNTRNRQGSGIITLDSIDGQLTHIYGIKWRRCW
jgi:hypothetical protein